MHRSGLDRERLRFQRSTGAGEVQSPRFVLPFDDEAVPEGIAAGRAKELHFQVDLVAAGNEPQLARLRRKQAEGRPVAEPFAPLQVAIVDDDLAVVGSGRLRGGQGCDELLEVG
jgi:hypothetical protein